MEVTLGSIVSASVVGVIFVQKTSILKYGKLFSSLIYLIFTKNVIDNIIKNYKVCFKETVVGWLAHNSLFNMNIVF